MLSILPLDEKERKSAGVSPKETVFHAAEGGKTLGFCGAEEMDGIFDIRWLDVQGGDAFIIDGLIRAQLSAAAERGAIHASVTAKLPEDTAKKLYGGFDIGRPFPIGVFFRELKNCKKSCCE